MEPLFLRAAISRVDRNEYLLEIVLDVVHKSEAELGYSCLKEEQIQASCQVLKGQDTFLALPTEYGKSVFYALLPGAFDILKGNQPSISTTSIIISFLCIEKKGSIIVCISLLTAVMVDLCDMFNMERHW